MEPDSFARSQCEHCGRRDDLYLVTLTAGVSNAGNAAIVCSACRQHCSVDVAIPLVLVSPRILLGLQRLRKLDANLGHLLRAVEFG
jgi:hypothetical protein